MLPSRWLAVAVMVLILSCTVASASLKIDKVVCGLDGEGFCTTGARLTITGDDLDDLDGVYIGSTKDIQQRIKCVLDKDDDGDNVRTCVLSIDYVPGVYTMTGYEWDKDKNRYDKTVFGGSLALGKMYGFNSSDYGFSNGWVSAETASPVDGELVAAFNATTLASFKNWTIYGNFTPDSTYRVLFYSDVDMGMPTCGGGEPLAPTAAVAQTDSGYTNALVCTIRSRPGNMGMFSLLVQNVKTGAFLPGTTALSMVTVQPSLPEVTGATGACATNSVDCVNGATITFQGSRFNTRDKANNVIVIRNTPEKSASSGIDCTVTEVTDTSLSCTLSIPDPSAVVKGSFGVYARVRLCTMNMWSEEKYLGNLMSGTFLGQTTPGFTVTAIDVVNAGQIARGVTQNNVYTGGWYAVFGVFDASHNLQLEFYNTQKDGTGVPTCTGYAITNYMINCTGVTQTLGNLGMYNVLVKDHTTGYYIPTSTTVMDPILVFAPLPTVTSASGSCAEKSAECNTGSRLTLTGQNFVKDKKNEVVFTQSGLACAADTATTSTSLSCTLTVDKKVAAGTYPMYVRSQACASGMMTPNQPAGYLRIGQGPDVKGWVSSISTTCTEEDRGPGGNAAAVAFAIVFGLITLGFIIASIVMCCCCTCTRKRRAPINYHPDTLSDRYWNADRAVEMNGQGTEGVVAGAGAFGAPVATAMGTTAVTGREFSGPNSGAPLGVGGAAAATVPKGPAPMPDEESTMPVTQARQVDQQAASGFSQSSATNKKFGGSEFA